MLCQARRRYKVLPTAYESPEADVYSNNRSKKVVHEPSADIALEAYNV